MATVTTPAGDVLEGVTGSLLAYYRGEGYEIVEDESAAVQFPVHYPPAEEAVDPGPPAKSATKSTWVEFAVTRGITQEDAEALTKDELIEQVGSD